MQLFRSLHNYSNRALRSSRRKLLHVEQDRSSPPYSDYYRVGTGESILQSTVNAVGSGARVRGEVEKRMLTQLKSHVIVFRYNHLGKYVIDKRESLGFDYVVITKDSQMRKELL